MKLRQKIVSLFMAAATAVTALSVTAFATDPVGTNPTVLKDGVQATAQIKHDESRDNDNGHNYNDFKFTAPAEGIMILKVDSAINHTQIKVYDDVTKQEIECAERNSATGKYTSKVGVDRHYIWDEGAGLYAGTLSYKVEKGDYIIRVSRVIGEYLRDVYGDEGNGRIHITAEMKKPDAPSSVKVSKKTENSFTLTWAEPEGVDSYDVRYKASSAKSWTTVEDIEDNTVTISKLKANTKYSYCIRSKAGEIIGDWSKAAAVTTNNPANVKLTAPALNSTITITWKEVSGASGYNFSYSTDNKNWTTASVKDTSYAMKVASGKKYYYKVQAKTSAKKGSWSATKSITIG